MLAPWVRRNCRQLVSVCRIDAGGTRWRLRIRRIVEAPTRWPTLSSSPWILTYPQRHAGIMSDRRSSLVSDPGPASGPLQTNMKSNRITTTISALRQKGAVSDHLAALPAGQLGVCSTVAANSVMVGIETVDVRT